MKVVPEYIQNMFAVDEHASQADVFEWLMKLRAGERDWIGAGLFAIAYTLETHLNVQHPDEDSEPILVTIADRLAAIEAAIMTKET